MQKGKCTMFAIIATKPLNDNTCGFRYNVFGVKGIVRLRKKAKRYGVNVQGDCTKALHVGKLSVYVETKLNRQRWNKRRMHHFAG